MSQYRRHHPRLADPEVAIVVPGDREAIATRVDDLSAGGARVRIGDSLPVGAELELELTDLAGESAQAVRLRARVVRLSKAGDSCELALEFVDRLEGSAMVLLALVERHRRHASPRLGDPPLFESEPSASSARRSARDPEGSPGSARAGSAVVEGRRSAAAVPAPARSEVAAGRASAGGGDERDELLARAERALREQIARAAEATAAVEALRAGLAAERALRATAERALVELQAEVSRLRFQPQPSREPGVEQGSPHGSEGGPGGLEREVGGGRLLGPEEVGSQVLFARHLRDGARLRPTERFARFEPVSRIDVQVHELASRARNLWQMRELAGRRVSEEEMVRVLWALFDRGLIQLEPADRGGRPPAAAGSGAAS
jgi:hypothetical protein